MAGVTRDNSRQCPREVVSNDEGVTAESRRKTMTNYGERQDASDAEIWVNVCATYCGKRLAKNPPSQQRGSK